LDEKGDGWEVELCVGSWPNWFELTNMNEKTFWMRVGFVTTLALGSWPRQGLAKVRAKYEAQESHFMLPRVQESVREWTLILPSELPLWELKSQWTPECLESDCKGQNPMDWRVFYIIENLFKRRCLKWACMTHLDT